MIVIKDLSERALNELKMKLGSVCYVVADMGAPETYRVTLSDEAMILYKARNEYVWIEYDGKQYELYLSDFATMEIL